MDRSRAGGKSKVTRVWSPLAGAKFLWGLVTFGALFAFVAFIGDFWIASVVLFVTGISNMFFQVPMLTLMQQITEDRYRGRIFALRTALVRVITVVGLLGAGVLAERIGISVSVGIVGGVVLAVGLVGWMRPALREA